MDNSFYDVLTKYRGFDFKAFLGAVTANQVQRILNKESLSELDLLALLSPAAATLLEPMARQAHRLTLAHFGRVIGLYAPLYLSNYCENECLYCGFKRSNRITRRKLTVPEALAEGREVARSGIRHILLLTGESRTQSPLPYIEQCIAALKPLFSSISIEIYPLKTDEYARLIAAGVDGLTIYQETYDEQLYEVLHKAGPKRDYRFRLDAPQRAAEANMRQVNVGALLGLADFRQESFFTGLHLRWLEQNYPALELGFSVPRIQRQTGNFQPAAPVSDAALVQIVTALRLFLPRAGISISTRENNAFRKNLLGLGVTRMSAGSRTEVGGYATGHQTEGQFEVADTSNVSEVCEMISRKGYQPIFKDWQQL